MTRHQWWKTTCAFVTTVGLLEPSALMATEAGAPTPALTRIAPRSSDFVAKRVVDAASEPRLTPEQKLALIRQKIKYVFVLFQENRSFDQHFGTFPGANGLFPHTNQPGWSQHYVDTNNNVQTITPFKIPTTVTNTANQTVQLYPADTDSVDHSHTGIVNSIDYVNGTTLNDRYALNEEGLTTDSNGNIVSRSTGAPYTTLTPPSEAAVQKAELVLGHLDCDTVPFLWQYADRFALFDNFHMTVTGPSTPNAIAMIAGQSGLTQWALHPSESARNIAGTTLASSGGEPVTADPGPFAGSNFDYSPVKPPYGPNDESPATPALNQTYASLPLSFMGNRINEIIKSDENPALDLTDVQADINTIASKNAAVNWGWFQEGYDHEPTDGTGPATYASYITHHNGPQYFGYLGDNTNVLSHNLHGLGDFYTAINAGALPEGGGVFYVRGGYGNNDGLLPVDPTPSIQANFAGSDDHPGYSDAQIAEALLADSVNAIASSKYWNESAIIITYDETDGLWDHVPSAIRVDDSFGNPLSGGPRIPTIVISPYAAVHTITSAYAEHSSVIKFIDELFGLVPLENLPNEARAKALGATSIQPNMGPVDGEYYISDLTEAFDNARLSGTAAKLPAEYAEIPASIVHSLPHYNGQGCYALNIVPTDYVNGTLVDPAPADFNPRPSSSPGIPTQPGWTP
jgi:phospholipase C